MARDCRGRGDPNLQQNKQTAFDSEYTALMAELGEGGGGGGPAASGRPAGAVNAPAQEQRVPPWRIPENWNTNSGSFPTPNCVLLTLLSLPRCWSGSSSHGFPAGLQPKCWIWLWWIRIGFGLSRRWWWWCWWGWGWWRSRQWRSLRIVSAHYRDLESCSQRTVTTLRWARLLRLPNQKSDTYILVPPHRISP